MPRAALYTIIAVLLVGGGILAYQALERDRNTLQIDVGPNGVKIDPPGR